MFFGELGLDGQLRPVPGVLPAVATAAPKVGCLLATREGPVRPKVAVLSAPRCRRPGDHVGSRVGVQVYLSWWSAVAPDRRHSGSGAQGVVKIYGPRTLAPPPRYRAATMATGLMSGPWQRTRFLAVEAPGPALAALGRVSVVFVAVALPRKSARAASGPPGLGPWSSPGGASGPAWPPLAGYVAARADGGGLPSSRAM
jgi:hypothetical protein